MATSAQPEAVLAEAQAKQPAPAKPAAALTRSLLSFCLSCEVSEGLKVSYMSS